MLEVVPLYAIITVELLTYRVSRSVRYSWGQPRVGSFVVEETRSTEAQCCMTTRRGEGDDRGRLRSARE